MLVLWRSCSNWP